LTNILFYAIVLFTKTAQKEGEDAFTLKCLAHEMQSIFHGGAAYFTGVHPQLNSTRLNKKNKLKKSVFIRANPRHNWTQINTGFAHG